MLRRILFVLLCGILLAAQTPISGFPPGTFSNRAALDGAGGSFSLTAGTGVGSATTSTSVNYAGVTWGSGCNAVVFIVYWYNTATTDTISGITAAGAGTVSQIANAKDATNNGGQSIDVWQITSPSATSATVAVTYSAATTYNSFVQPYCLVSGNTTAGTATHNATNANNCSAGFTVNPTVPAGGQAVVGSGSVSGTVVNFTNATSDGVYTGGGTQDRFGHTTGTGSVTITSTSAGTDNCTLVAVPYGP